MEDGRTSVRSALDKYDVRVLTGFSNFGFRIITEFKNILMNTLIPKEKINSITAG
jgi:hypothetical protein